MPLAPLAQPQRLTLFGVVQEAQEEIIVAVENRDHVGSFFAAMTGSHWGCIRVREPSPDGACQP